MKINVVTGGGSGIGKAVGAMLPKEETVIITGRSVGKLEKTVEELNASGCRAVAAACDVSKREDVKSWRSTPPLWGRSPRSSTAPGSPAPWRIGRPSCASTRWGPYT